MFKHAMNFLRTVHKFHKIPVTKSHTALHDHEEGSLTDCPVQNHQTEGPGPLQINPSTES